MGLGNAALGRKRLLVIEDDPHATDNWTRLRASSDIVPVSTFHAAWRATELDTWRTQPFDYIFLDPHLPDGDGRDLLDRLSALDPRPAVAVLSAFLDAREALAIHGRCVIAVPKPANEDVLLGVAAILEESRTGRSLVDQFAATYGLSPQETRLLAAAARETRNVEAADELGCSHATVRTYWRRIFGKTGRTNAREVIALLFRFALERSAVYRSAATE